MEIEGRFYFVKRLCLVHPARFLDSLVRFINFGEFLFGGLAHVLAQVADLVRMVLLGSGAIGFLDLVVCGIRGDFQNLIVVLQ